MTRFTFFALIFGCVLATTAIARDLPDHYPKDGLGIPGQIDAIHFDENRVVINDISYQLSSDLVVHSLTAASVSKARLRPGLTVAYKVGSGRTITEFWLLPRDFDIKEWSGL